METLVDRILLRPLPTSSELSRLGRDEILRVGQYFGTYASMDEVENNRLDDLPSRIQEDLEQLQPFELKGYFEVNPDIIDRLLRVTNHYGVYLQQITIDGNYIDASGFQAPDVNLNLSNILTPTTQPEVVGAQTFAWNRNTIPARSIVENFVVGARIEDPLWRGRYKLTITPDEIQIIAYEIQATHNTLQDYVTTNRMWHKVTEFRSIPEANIDFLGTYLQTQIHNLQPEVLFQLRTIQVNTSYVLQVQTEPKYWEWLDLLLQQEIQKLLTPNGFLRYYAVTPNPLEQVFLALEDLIPTSSNLVAPFDRKLQRYYAQIQGYSEEEAFRQVLLRRDQFLTTRNITHRLTQRMNIQNPIQKDIILHLMASYWHHLTPSFQSPSITIEGDLLIIQGRILSLEDALAYYILMLQAQDLSSQPLDLYLKILTTLDLKQRPSELVQYLDQTPTEEGLVPSCSNRNCPLPPVAQGVKSYHILTLPKYYSLSDLEKKGYTASVSYWDNGVYKENWSLYSSTKYTLHDFRIGLVTIDKPITLLPETVISSQDYKFDIVSVEDYYRFDVVASTDDKPVNRLTLFYLPQWIELEHPSLLPTVLFWWKRGLLLTSEAKEWYRLTKKLWATNTTALLFKDLIPSYWSALPTDRVIAVIMEILNYVDLI